MKKIILAIGVFSSCTNSTPTETNNTIEVNNQDTIEINLSDTTGEYIISSEGDTTYRFMCGEMGIDESVFED